MWFSPLNLYQACDYIQEIGWNSIYLQSFGIYFKSPALTIIQALLDSEKFCQAIIFEPAHWVIKPVITDEREHRPNEQRNDTQLSNL